MANEQYNVINGPKSLLDLATHSLFRVFSKILPDNMTKVEYCNNCVLNTTRHSLDVLNYDPCKCFRYYQHVRDLYCDLPLALRHQTLDIATREMDNSKSVQTLLGR